jgi:hypothetical protein
MVLTLEKVPDSNAHDDHEDQDYELSIHLLLPSAIVAQSSVSATHSHGPLHCYPGGGISLGLSWHRAKRSHAFDVETATQIATQLFGTGWQQAASSGTAGTKNSNKSGLVATT